METTSLHQIVLRAREFKPAPSAPVVVVDPLRQELLVCDANAAVVATFPVSTALRGLGNREGSNRTPTGFHRITDTIGAAAPPARIFRDRRDTGMDWHEGLTDENIILARILRLEGLEPGLNKGPAIDSYERYIYIHGTNQTSRVGTPLSHGCVCLRPHDIISLFDLVVPGTIVFIDAFHLSINDVSCAHLHFIGVLGSGMSAIAQYLQWQGVMVSGSDRMLLSDDTAPVRAGLLALGCNLSSQDGTGISASTDAVVVSSAIEETNPDIAAARARGLPVFHRSDCLAAIVAQKTTIAVAGTSGKSTVTAMIFEFLTACGAAPSLISGAALRRLESQGVIGNAWCGESDLLVVEADESDGTLVKYHPAAGIVLNISKDHKGIDEIEQLFRKFAAQSAWSALNADDPGLDAIPAATRFGTGAAATWRPDAVAYEPLAVVVKRDAVTWRLPLPGPHNAQNLFAALCVCEHFGCTAIDLSRAVPLFQGVARRFAITHTSSGVHVVDDFAHNPAKIAAAVKAARGIGLRIVAIYQPHGFGPTRFLFNDYIETFRTVFKAGDELYLLPIYYAGGTAKKDISSQDIITGLGPVSFQSYAVNSRDELMSRLARSVKKDDCVLLMGARDPSLSGFADKIIALFNTKEP